MNKNSKTFYDQGYALFPSLIDSEKIQKLLFELSELKRFNSLYYSQSEHNWRRIKSDLDDFNLMNCSFQNFTDILWAHGLGSAGRDILQSKEINNCLKEISGNDQFIMWQNMLFDKSTGTVDHIDSWYLDTNPYGNLLAVWVALENIDGEGGSFHLYPKSHLDNNKEWINKDHDSFIKWSRDLSEKFSRKSMKLRRGDVLFWHPMLLHGSSSQVKAGISRKSITAHYCPANFIMGGGGLNDTKFSKDYQRKLKKQIKNARSFGYPIFARRSRKKIFAASLLGLTKYLTNFGNDTRMLMNRKFYKK